MLQNTREGTELISWKGQFLPFCLCRAGCPAGGCGSELWGCICSGSTCPYESPSVRSRMQN